jgi:hypothetical protein
MIDGMDDDTFSVCVDMLWPILKYKYLKRDDVRRIDLMERISDKVSDYTRAPKQPLLIGKNCSGSVDKYVEAIRFYFDNGYLPVEKGSRAEKYAIRAREIMNNYEKSENPQAEAENLFVISLGLLREAFSAFDSKSIKPASTVNCHVGKEDASLLERIRTYPFEKQMPAALKFVAKGEKQDARQKDFEFLNNVLIYCDLMQIQGSFRKGEAR